MIRLFSSSNSSALVLSLPGGSAMATSFEPSSSVYYLLGLKGGFMKFRAARTRRGTSASSEEDTVCAPHGAGIVVRLWSRKAIEKRSKRASTGRS